MRLLDVTDMGWPTEVGLVYSQIDGAGDLPVHLKRRLKNHISRMRLENKLLILVMIGYSICNGLMLLIYN